MQSILVINGSARLNGDTCKKIETHFATQHYELIHLAEYHLEDYNYNNSYSEEDRFEMLTHKMESYDTIVFATPVYWYAMSGRMKTLLDRTTAWVTTNKAVGRSMKGKNISLLAVGTDAMLPDGFAIPFILTAAYFEMNYMGATYYCTK